MSEYNKNFVNLDKVNAGKLCSFRTQHINSVRLPLCTKPL